MSEPRRLSLDDIGTVSRGRSGHRPRNDPALYGGPYPFFQTGDVREATFHLTNYSQSYNELGLAQSRIWPAGTLCITIAANIAESAVMSAPGCFPDSIVGFQPDPAVADVTYVKYSIDTLKRSMRQISDGATQDNLSVEKLLSFKMRVPDLEEQRKISSVISAFDDLIENSRRRVEVLQETARALYQRLVEGQSGASLPSLPLSATVEVMSGGTPKKSEPKNWGGTIPFFTPRDAGKDWVALSSADRLSELGAKTKASPIFPEGTVFITARGTVGKLAIVGTPMAMNQSCYALRGKAGYPQSFVLLFMDAAVRQLRQNTGGATFDTIIRSTFDTVMVPTPSATEARAFAKECDPLIAAEIALCKMIAALEAQREYLLPKLISGELSVSSLDIDVTRIEARADLWRPTTVGG